MRIAVCALYVIMLTVVARPGQAQRFDGAYQAADVVLRESDFLTLIDGLDLDPLTTRPAAMDTIAGFGVSRQGNQLVRASVGASLGFVYFVAENLMLAVGKLGVVPPMLGAFFPFAIFLVVGFAILLTMES